MCTIYIYKYTIYMVDHNSYYFYSGIYQLLLFIYIFFFSKITVVENLGDTWSFENCVLFNFIIKFDNRIILVSTNFFFNCSTSFGKQPYLCQLVWYNLVSFLLGNRLLSGAFNLSSRCVPMLYIPKVTHTKLVYIPILSLSQRVQ